MISAALSLALLAVPQDTAAIEKAVHSFIAAVKAKDYDGAREYVKTTTPSFKRLEMVDLIEKEMNGATFTYEATNISSKQTGSFYTVNLSTRFGPGKSSPFPEQLFAEVVDGKVKFLPKLAGDKAGPTGFWVVLVDNDSEKQLGQVFILAKKAAQKTAALSNGKQVGTSVFIYMADNDDNFPGSNWQKAIDPYLKNKELLNFSYEGKTYSYSMNPRLFKFNATAIAHPEKTVMLFIGETNKLNFLFEGRTIIVYADGHAKVIDKEQAKKLIWKP